MPSARQWFARLRKEELNQIRKTQLRLKSARLLHKGGALLVGFSSVTEEKVTAVSSV